MGQLSVCSFLVAACGFQGHPDQLTSHWPVVFSNMILVQNFHSTEFVHLNHYIPQAFLNTHTHTGSVEFLKEAEVGYQLHPFFFF
jgi:hypothetical protein